MNLQIRLLTLFLISFPALATSSKMDFWKQQKKGSNFFNQVETQERLLAAKNMGLEIVRLTFTKWKSHDPKLRQGEFLLGDLNQYAGLVEKDLLKLIEILNQVDALGLKVVLTTLSLPGNRWRQDNGNKNDLRLWEEEKFQQQAIQFWRDLAKRLKDHPAVVGYNLKNEPDVERATPRLNDWYKGDYAGWCQKVQGTTSDLSLFYEKIISAIREVDTETPIVLDTGFYATAWGFKCLRAQKDPSVIYSFHMYEPYAYTYFGSRGKHTYPGKAPLGEGDQPDILEWNYQKLKEYMEPVVSWAKQNKIESNRIYVGEFGVFRQAPGAEKYLADLIRIFNEYQWHWGFYSFREDTWPGMDYEMGTRSLPAAYWEAEARGEQPTRVPYYRDNALIKVIKEGLKK